MHVIYILQEGALRKKCNTIEHDKGGDEGMWLHGEEKKRASYRYTGNLICKKIMFAL